MRLNYWIFLLAFSSCVQASETGIELSQSCVEVGCFPGDPPGLPILIETPGSYYLSSDIVVTESEVNAIRINANDVKLDLRGNTIRGPNVCDLVTQTCSPAGGGRGVSLASFEENSGISLINGQIDGFGNYCASVGRSGFAADLVLSNCFAGIGLGRGAVGERLRTYNNRYGIDIIGTAVVRDSFSFDNIQNGIQINAGRKSIIENSHVSANGAYGIRTLSPTLVRNCMISENGSSGIHALDGVAGSKFEGNVILANGGPGLFLADLTSGAVAVEGNTFSNNATEDAGSQILENTAGQIIELGLNMCAATTQCL